jgi:hypothetical protein
MARKRGKRIVVLFIIGALVSAGTGMAYRAFMAPWRGDVGEPLIAAAFVGVAFFIFSLLGLNWVARREELLRRDRES